MNVLSSINRCRRVFRRDFCSVFIYNQCQSSIRSSLHRYGVLHARRKAKEDRKNQAVQSLNAEIVHPVMELANDDLVRAITLCPNNIRDQYSEDPFETTLLGSHRQVHPHTIIYEYESPRNDEWCSPLCIGRVSAWYEIDAVSETPNALKDWIEAVVESETKPTSTTDIIQRPTSELYSRLFMTTLRKIRRTFRRVTELDPRPFLAGRNKDEPISLVGISMSARESFQISTSGNQI